MLVRFEYVRLEEKDEITTTCDLNKFVLTSALLFRMYIKIFKRLCIAIAT